MTERASTIPLSPDDVVSMALNGDPDSFSKVRTSIRRNVRSLTNNWQESDIDDLEQAVFEKLVKSPSRPRISSMWEPWIRTVVRNVIIDAARRKSRRPDLHFCVDFSSAGEDEVRPDEFLFVDPEYTPDDECVRREWMDRLYSTYLGASQMYRPQRDRDLIDQVEANKGNDKEQISILVGYWCEKLRRKTEEFDHLDEAYVVIPSDVVIKLTLVVADLNHQQRRRLAALLLYETKQEGAERLEVSSLTMYRAKRHILKALHRAGPGGDFDSDRSSACMTNLANLETFKDFALLRWKTAVAPALSVISVDVKDDEDGINPWQHGDRRWCSNRSWSQGTLRMVKQAGTFWPRIRPSLN